MRRHILLVAGLILLALFAAAAKLFVVATSKARKPSPGPAERLRSLPVTIQVRPDVRGQAAEFHGEAARLLNAALAPGEDAAWALRMNRFAGLDRGDARIVGWGGFVEGAEPTADGVVVTIRMQPIVTFRGKSATTADDIIEEYLIVDGHARFVKSVALQQVQAGPDALLID